MNFLTRSTPCRFLKAWARTFGGIVAACVALPVIGATLLYAMLGWLFTIFAFLDATQPWWMGAAAFLAWLAAIAAVIATAEVNQ